MIQLVSFNSIVVCGQWQWNMSLLWLEYEIHKLSRVPIYSVFYLEICTPNWIISSTLLPRYRHPLFVVYIFINSDAKLNRWNVRGHHRRKGTPSTLVHLLLWGWWRWVKRICAVPEMMIIIINIILVKMTKGASCQSLSGVTKRFLKRTFNRIPGDFNNWTANSIYTHWLIQIVKENTARPSVEALDWNAQIRDWLVKI